MPLARPKYDPQYEWEGDWLVHRYVQTTGDVLRFQARDIRKDRTGIHARVVVSYNQVSMGQDVFNVERARDRTHLVNVARKALSLREYATDFPEVDFSHAFDLFCEGLWDTLMLKLRGGPMKGNAFLQIPQLVRGLVVEGGGTSLYAPPGQGKTYTLLTLAVCIDAGLSIPGVFEVRHAARVLFINLERSESSMLYRLGRVNRALGLEQDRELCFLNARGQSLRQVFQAARDTMLANNCRVVAVDSLSRIGSGSMVDDEDANSAMDQLNSLAETWLLSAHTPRADESHMFGSVMFDAAVDVAASLRSQQQGSSTGIALQVTKENDLGSKPLHLLAFDWSPTGLERVRRALPGEFSELVLPPTPKTRKTDTVQDMTQFLLEAGEPMTASDIALEMGLTRTRVSRALNEHEGHWFSRVRKAGKEVLYSVRVVNSEMTGREDVRGNGKNNGSRDAQPQGPGAGGVQPPQGAALAAKHDG